MSTTNSRPQGFTLIEVLITLVIIAIGVLGLAALQGRSHLSAAESAQRAQAVALINDMASRININRADVENYVTATPLGTGTADADCTLLAPGKDRDQCEWSELLKGAAEERGATKTGAMIGAKGCVEVVQTANPAPTICRPAIVRITTAWQGLVESAAPALTCGKGAYGDDTLRRAVATQVIVGLPRCI
ncbi:MAG: type IV pilus modification protein PilV [Panacagrimonas sp.]